MRELGARMQARSMAVAMLRSQRRASSPCRQAKRREMRGPIFNNTSMPMQPLFVFRHFKSRRMVIMKNPG